MNKYLTITAATLLSCSALSVQAAENLELWDKKTSYTVQLDGETLEITRQKTPPALIGGSLQPMSPAEGVTTVGEIDIIEALGKEGTLLVDMRTQEHHLDLGTIPSAINIPFTEVSMNMDKFGCEKVSSGWNCADATTKVYAFCNSSACAQSPTGIRVMIREGYPANLIYYYRGGYQEWTIHGLPTAEGEL